MGRKGCNGPVEAAQGSHGAPSARAGHSGERAKGDSEGGLGVEELGDYLGCDEFINGAGEAYPMLYGIVID